MTCACLLAESDPGSNICHKYPDLDYARLRRIFCLVKPFPPNSNSDRNASLTYPGQ